MPTVTDIYTEARALLNDPGNTLGIFTDAVLLPFVKKAYVELQNELSNNGISTQYSAYENIIIAASSSSYDAVVTLVTQGFLYPTKMEEKAPGETDDMYFLVTEEPEDIAVENFIPSETIGYWTWRNGLIFYRPPTAERRVRLQFASVFPTLTTGTDVIKTINSQTFLAARLAAIAALVVGSNAERAKIYQSDAEYNLGVIINQAVKRDQGTPTRRRPFGNAGR